MIPTPQLTNAESDQARHVGRASPFLRRRCPACFGRDCWGGDPDRCVQSMTSLIVDCHWIFFLRNPDVIIALDGNFQHRRFAHVKDDPRILLEEDHYNWITDTEIAEAKEYIQVHRSRPDMDHHQKASSQVPRHILDECEKSY